jgi:tRNA nucleotidyltransferase (CCA-adding enzyme)
MITEPFLSGRELIEKLEVNGHQAFFVGGSVRDLLLKRPVRDIDIATSASPASVQQIFNKVIPVGIEHGTVIVRYKHQSFEVTTFRLDGKYSDQRHPDEVKFIHTIDQDLKRRDFTINALAMDKSGKIIDLFNGKKDLQNKIIRTVGNGYDRFREDPLRIIRALRFSSQLGFTVEQDTLQDMIRVKGGIDKLAVERIMNEFTKLFAGEYAAGSINYMKSTGIYHHLPLLKEHPDLFCKLPGSLKPLYSFGEVIALFHFLKPFIPVADWIKEWKCSNQMKQEANQLTQALSDYQRNGLDRWLVYQLDNAFFNGFYRLTSILFPERHLTETAIKQLVDSLPIQSKQALALGGNDLIELYPQAGKGPWLQRTISRMERDVVTGKVVNTKYALKEWLICNPPELN